MLGTLLRQELLAHLLTWRLLVALVCTVVLTVLVTWVASLDFSTRTAHYRAAGLPGRMALEGALPATEPANAWMGCFGGRMAWWLTGVVSSRVASREARKISRGA